MKTMSNFETPGGTRCSEYIQITCCCSCFVKKQVTVPSRGLRAPASLTLNHISGTPSPECLILESEAGKRPAGVPEMTQPKRLPPQFSRAHHPPRHPARYHPISCQVLTVSIRPRPSCVPAAVAPPPSLVTDPHTPPSHSDQATSTPHLLKTPVAHSSNSQGNLE